MTTDLSTDLSTDVTDEQLRAADEQEWSDWHAARERDLSSVHGWLTPVAYLPLPSAPTALADVPGLWWADADGAHHRAAGPAGEVATHVVDEAGSQVVSTYLPAGRGAADDAEVAVELVRRTGRYALRLRDPWAPTRRDFTGVPTYPYDRSWVLEAPVRWYDEPRAAVVGAARPGLLHHVQAIGEVDVRHGGRVATLVLTGFPGGAALLFSDEAPGLAPWRILTVPREAGETLRLDLNRAVNLPFAFSDHGTCPAPLPGNHVPFAVTAGERAPR
jgi:uncharacterized protein